MKEEIILKLFLLLIILYKKVPINMNEKIILKLFYY